MHPAEQHYRQTMDDIHRSLEQLYATDLERQQWLNTPNAMLDGRTPDDFIHGHQADTVLAVLDMILSSAGS